MEQQLENYRKPLKVKPVERLSQEQVKSIDGASKRLLSEVGITCAGEEAAKVYKEAGCDVTDSSNENNKSWNVRFPSKVLEKALKTVPSKVVLGARDPDNILVLNAHEPAVYFGTGSETNIYLKSEIAEYVNCNDKNDIVKRINYKEEPGSLKALCESARLIDHLENADFFIRNINIQDTDIEAKYKDVNVFFSSMINTGKHVQGGLTEIESLQDLLKLGRMIVGENKYLPLSFIVCPIKSPLYMVSDSSEKVIAIANEKVPMVISSSPQGGLTAPIQEEGIVTQINAEILAGIALSQLANPGTPVLYGSVPVRARLDTLHDCYGTAEFPQYSMCCVQMARHYGIPCYSSAGVADTKRPGLEAIMEKVYSYKAVASAGAHYIHYSFGLLHGTNIFSPLQAVLDNASISLVKALLRPADFDKNNVEESVNEITNTSKSSGMFTRGIRKQLRRRVVSGTYEFSSDKGEDVMIAAQTKMSSYLSDKTNLLDKETAKRVFETIPGLAEYLKEDYYE